MAISSNQNLSFPIIASCTKFSPVGPKFKFFFKRNTSVIKPHKVGVIIYNPLSPSLQMLHKKFGKNCQVVFENELGVKEWMTHKDKSRLMQ